MQADTSEAARSGVGLLAAERTNKSKGPSPGPDRPPAPDPALQPAEVAAAAPVPAAPSPVQWLRSGTLHWLQRQAGNRAVALFVAGAKAKAATLQRAVNPTPVVRHSSLKVIGDGTAAHPGLTLGDFERYIAQQADWFTESSFSEANREKLWQVANMFQEGSHIGAALGELKLRDLIAAPAADMVKIRGYAEGGREPPDTVRITRPDPSIARVSQLGAAMIDLGAFVPPEVLRVVISQSGLEKLVDEGLIGVLRDYYRDFTPTLENPDELDHVLNLLRGGLAPFATLKDWIHDLHHLTTDTLVQLVANVANRSRSKPVLLILMSGLDWNAAFLQSSELESAVRNPKNLALILQGSKTLPDVTTRVNKTADDYGQKPVGAARHRLGQVVIAGHGQARSVEQATSGVVTGTDDDKTVAYGDTPIEPTAAGDDSEKLIDAILSRMNPNDARVVFAGCLVGSHNIPEHPDLTGGTKKAAKAINDSIKADPNLRDLVQKRMKALKVKGKVEAANASTTFGAFNLDAAGKARLSLVWDPDVGGPKAKYVKTGAEPEGALRAALETFADPKLGADWTTKAMKEHNRLFAAKTTWWESLTRTAFQIVLDAAGAGDVDPALMANLQHRVESWLLFGWPESADVDRVVGDVKAAEAPKIYPVMLGTTDHPPATYPHLPIAVNEAWMDVDAAKGAAFMAAIAATPLKRVELAKHIADAVVDPRLPTLLAAPDPLKPTKEQLVLALTIAVKRKGAMPAAARKLLVDAAGGKRTASFPAPLNVPDLLDGASEIDVLRSIGLAPGAPAVGGGAAPADEANVDLDKDKTNEMYVNVKPHLVAIGAAERKIFRKPDKASGLVATMKGGELLVGVTPIATAVQIVGEHGGWTAVAVRGRIGFVDGALP